MGLIPELWPSHRPYDRIRPTFWGFCLFVVVFFGVFFGGLGFMWEFFGVLVCFVCLFLVVCLLLYFCDIFNIIIHIHTHARNHVQKPWLTTRRGMGGGGGGSRALKNFPNGPHMSDPA